MTEFRWFTQAQKIGASLMILLSFGIVLGALDGFDTVSRMVVRYDESRLAFVACSFVIALLQMSWLHAQWNDVQGGTTNASCATVCVVLGALLASAGLIVAAFVRVDTHESAHVAAATAAFGGIFLFQLVLLSRAHSQTPCVAWMFWVVGAGCAGSLVPDSDNNRAALEYAVIVCLHASALAISGKEYAGQARRFSGQRRGEPGPGPKETKIFELKL